MALICCNASAGSQPDRISRKHVSATTAHIQALLDLSGAEDLTAWLEAYAG